MDLVAFVSNYGSVFSSEGPIAVWKICPIFTGKYYFFCHTPRCEATATYLFVRPFRTLCAALCTCYP